LRCTSPRRSPSRSLQRSPRRVRPQGSHHRSSSRPYPHWRIFRRTRPLYMAELISHRVLRYSTGILHVRPPRIEICSSLHGRPSIAVPRAPPRVGSASTAAGKVRLPIPALDCYYYFRCDKRPWVRLVRICAPDTADVDKARHAMNRATDVAVAGIGLIRRAPVGAGPRLSRRSSRTRARLYRTTRVGKDGETSTPKLRNHGRRRRGHGRRYARHRS